MARVSRVNAKAKGAAKKSPPRPAPPPRKQLEVDADDVRARIAKLTSSDSVPDPIAISKVEVVSTGMLSLDSALGVGGFARGRLHSIEGQEGSGKTALACAAVGQHQRLDPSSVHCVVDVEGTLALNFCSALGVNIDPKRFIIFRPETAEEACIMVMSLMGYVEKDRVWRRDPKVVPVSSIIYDSWAGSATEEVGLAQLARVGAAWIPKIATTAERMQTTLYWINQIREKPGVLYGDPRYSPGGRALKHAQTTRLWVSTTNIEKDEATKLRIGHDLKIDVQKNKLAPPFHQVFLHLNYTTGFDRIVDAFTFLERRGVNLKESQNGNIYTFDYETEEGKESIRENGRAAFLDALRGDPYAGEAFLEHAHDVASKTTPQENRH